VDQLYATAGLIGIRCAVAFPDLHPGKGGPVGCAFVSEGMIYPHIVGADIGCGMALFTTDLPARKAKLDQWAQQHFDLEHPWEGNVQDYLAKREIASTEFDEAMGTIGCGNHFAELQAIEKVHCAPEFAETGLSRDCLSILVHSGSRGLGARVLRNHTQQHGGKPVKPEEARDYLREYDLAVKWARANRALIARRFGHELGAKQRVVWDACHNSITAMRNEGETLWIHRKGASPGNTSFVIIPGSRGSLTYVVKPLVNAESNGWSIAHGAGRKWSRSESRLRMRERFRPPQLAQTSLGGRVICEDRALLYEEAPGAYKDIDRVIQDLIDGGLASVVATLRPLLTYKTRRLSR
jgi:release factor H-coupled RctB family protein